MVQGGDPLGTGKGGESIWGGPFPDEFHPDNKHDRRGVVRKLNKKYRWRSSLEFAMGCIAVVKCVRRLDRGLAD